MHAARTSRCLCRVGAMEEDRESRTDMETEAPIPPPRLQLERIKASTRIHKVCKIKTSGPQRSVFLDIF